MIRHAARAFVIQARVAALEEMQYRVNALTRVLSTMLDLAVTIVSLSILYQHVDSINGWSRDELMVVVGVFFALGAVIFGVVHLSIAEMTQEVLTGTFDYRLLRPVDAQLLACVQKVDVWRAFDLVAGIAIAITFAIRSSGAEGFGGAAAIGSFVLVFIIACILVVSFWTLIGSIVFFVIQGQGILWALDDIYDHVRWPLGLFGPGLRAALTFVFPVGIAVTVPAEALTGRLDRDTALLLIAITAAFIVLSRVVWHRAIARYGSASS